MCICAVVLVARVSCYFCGRRARARQARLPTLPQKPFATSHPVQPFTTSSPQTQASFTEIITKSINHNNITASNSTYTMPPKNNKAGESKQDGTIAIDLNTFLLTRDSVSYCSSFFIIMLPPPCLRSIHCAFVALKSSRFPSSFNLHQHISTTIAIHP